MKTTPISPKIEHIQFKVESSNVEKVAYQVLLKNLVVRFKNGKRYLYKDVPFEVINEIIHAESIGEAVNKLIVRQNYKYQQI